MTTSIPLALLLLAGTPAPDVHLRFTWPAELTVKVTHSSSKSTVKGEPPLVSGTQRYVDRSQDFTELDEYSFSYGTSPLR